MRYSVVLTLLAASAVNAQDMPLSDFLIPSEGWKKVEGKFTPVFGLSNQKGAGNSLIVWNADNKAQALIGGDGKPITSDLAGMIATPRLFIPGNGFAYALGDDSRSLRITHFPDKSVKVADMTLPVGKATALAATPDKSSLLIGDGAGKHVWVYRIEKDGMLSAGEKYITLRALPYVASTLNEKPRQEPRSDVSAFGFDSAGRIYAATNIGVQVFDPTGRLCGVLTNPSVDGVTAMCFGGEKGDRLFIGCGSEIYSRRLNAKGASLDAKDKK